MRVRGCLFNLFFVGVCMLVFGLSAYFSFIVFVRGKSLATPALIGRPLAEARAVTSDLGLILEIDPSKERHSDEIPPGNVVWQGRRADSGIKRGSRIFVAQSMGPLVLEIPDLTGETARTALHEFSQRNLVIGNLSHIGVRNTLGIIAESPPRGTVVRSGTPVSLLVAIEEDPPAYVMPDLIDLPVDDIRASLEAAGFKLGPVRYESYPGIPDGTIIRQFPLAGSPVNSDETITLVASRQGTDTILDSQQPW